MKLSQKLKQLNACNDAVEWVGSKDLETAWKTCERADWMLWFAAKMMNKPGWSTHQEIVLAACWCARQAQKYWKNKNDKRLMDAIESAEKWAKNPTKENKAAAADASDAAYSAADDAANDAYSVADAAAAYSAAAAAYSAANYVYSADAVADAAAAYSAAAAAYSAADDAYSVSVAADDTYSVADTYSVSADDTYSAANDVYSVADAAYSVADAVADVYYAADDGKLNQHKIMCDYIRENLKVGKI